MSCLSYGGLISPFKEGLGERQGAGSNMMMLGRSIDVKRQRASGGQASGAQTSPDASGRC